MDWSFAPLLILVGVAAGFVNVMAGGGSLLTLPALILSGLEVPSANGSNRVALLIQNIVATRSFRRAGLSNLKLSLSLAACTWPGAVLGALSALALGGETFRKLLAGVMVAVLFITLWPTRRLKARTSGANPSAEDTTSHTRQPEQQDRENQQGRWRPTDISKERFWGAHIGMVALGFYGGFIQAGAGFILMPLLKRLLRLDLVSVNTHKVIIVGSYMVPTLIVFAHAGHVIWLAGLIMAVGSASGALIATRVQIKKGEGPVRIIFAIATLAMAIKLLMS